MSHRRGSPRCYIIGEKRPFQIPRMEGNLSRIHSWKVERREECGSAIIKPGYVYAPSLVVRRGENTTRNVFAPIPITAIVRLKDTSFTVN